MDSKNIVGAFTIEDSNEASVVKHHLQKLYSNISFEYQLDEITTNKETKIKFRFIFFDESLFTEINIFITKMNIKIKKYNLKKLKKG